MTHSDVAVVDGVLHRGIRGDDHHLFRVYKAYTSEARLALLQVLSWGCPKAPSQTFEQYLMASGLSRTSYRKAFNAQQREKISSNLSGDRFDISLLYKMIQLACHSLGSNDDVVWTDPDYTRLEYLLTRVKNSRNKLTHDVPNITQEKMVEEIETLRELLTKVVEMSGTLYCVNNGTVDQVLYRIHCNLNNIRDQPFAPLDLEDYGNHLLFDNLRATLRHDGAQELKQTYGSKILLNPLSFLDKSDCHLQVGEVFICLSIQDVRASTHCRLVHSKELLEHIDTTASDSNGRQSLENEAQNLSSLMILEGQPGSGKTTLLRLYISEWIAGGIDIKGLSDYDLVLYFECRDTCIDSFAQLLISHMPQTTSKFRSNDLMHIFLSLKALVLVDGLDELNLASHKVMRDILHLKSSCDLTLICTTRPEKIREVYKMASGRVKVVHMKIQGIPTGKREDFVRTYHHELKQRGVTQQDIGGLLDYLRHVPSHLEDFYRFPLNLVLLTFLWDSLNPRVTKITSMTALYLETDKLLIEKLLERFMFHPSTKHLSLAELTSKCDSFRAVMYEEALRAVAAGFAYLNKRATRRLKEHCVSLDLPAEEMFSSFLVSASSDHDLSEEAKFPHKGIQDFYAARHVIFLVDECYFADLSIFISRLDELLRNSSVPTFAWRQIVKHTRETLDQRVSIRNVLLEFQEDRSEAQSLGRYQGIICHVVNLLHSCGQHMLEHYAAEVVTLLDKAKGMSFEHWVEMLKESQYNLTLAAEISKVLPKSSWTVNDQHVKAAAAFLSHSCPSQLTIDIMSDPEQVPHLHSLLETAATCSCKIYLFFHHHWRHPESGLSNSFLLKIVTSHLSHSRSTSSSSTNSYDYQSPNSISARSIVSNVSDAAKVRIVELMGHFSGRALHMLPSSIKKLRLAIADDHDALDWFGALPTLSRALPSLRCIWVHVTAGVSPDLLPCLPRLLYSPRLYLSGVGDDKISWASRVASVLLPPESKYASVGLVCSSLSNRGVSQLAELLYHMGVGVYAAHGGGLLVASSNLSDSDLENVRDTVSWHLKCPFARLDDDDIWYNEYTYEEMYEYHPYNNGKSQGSDTPYTSLCGGARSEPLYRVAERPELKDTPYTNMEKSPTTYSAESEPLYAASSTYECMEEIPRKPVPLPPTPHSPGAQSPPPPNSPTAPLPKPPRKPVPSLPPPLPKPPPKLVPLPPAPDYTKVPLPKPLRKPVPLPPAPDYTTVPLPKPPRKLVPLPPPPLPKPPRKLVPLPPPPLPKLPRKPVPLPPLPHLSKPLDMPPEIYSDLPARPAVPLSPPSRAENQHQYPDSRPRRKSAFSHQNPNRHLRPPTPPPSSTKPTQTPLIERRSSGAKAPYPPTFTFPHPCILKPVIPSPLSPRLRDRKVTQATLF